MDKAEVTLLPPTQMLASPILMSAQAQQTSAVLHCYFYWQPPKISMKKKLVEKIQNLIILGMCY